MKLNVSMVEAAKMLGIRTDRMQALVESGDIPAWREGRNWKIPVNLLKEWNGLKAIEESEERRRHEKETVHSRGDG